MKTKLSQKDSELLITSRAQIDTTNPEYSYLFPKFDAGEDGNERDFVEAHIHDTSQNFIESIFVDKQLISIDVNDRVHIKTGTLLRRAGYDRGRYIVKYNFLRKLAGDTTPILIDKDGLQFNEPIDTSANGNVIIESDGRIFTKGEVPKELFLKDNKYFIHEISDSRKEVRLVTQQIKNDKYLRDFFNLQKETKLIGAIGNEQSHLTFFDPTNAANKGTNESTNLKFVSPNAEPFQKNIIGGALEIPNVFITRFEDRSQLDDSTLGGGPDEEFYDSEDGSVFIASFLMSTDTAETETGTIISNRDDNKFARHKKRLNAETVSFRGTQISIPTDEQLRKYSSEMRITAPEFVNIPLLTGSYDGRQALDILFNRYTIRVNKNKRITLSSNSTLRNVGRTYRWVISGYERTRIHSGGDYFPKYDYRWEYSQLKKSNVTIEAPNGGDVNGLAFQGKADEAQDLVFTINNTGCWLDIALEIELEEGSRFTESLFLPRVISTQGTNKQDTIKGID